MYCEEMKFAVGTGVASLGTGSTTQGTADAGPSPMTPLQPSLVAPEPAGIILSGEYPGRFTRLRTTA